MSPVLVLLLITHTDGRVIPTAVIQRAIVDVLGPVKVLAEDVPGTLLDDEAAQLGRDIHAAVVYRITFLRSDPPTIELRTWTDRTAPDGRWIVRRLDFKQQDDSLTEIARTTGFAAAAMVPQYGIHARERQSRVLGSIASAPSDSRLAVEHEAVPPVRDHPLLIDLLGSAGLADGGSLAWGGGLRASWTATRRLRPTTAVTGSTEDVDAAQTRASRLGLSVGGVLTLVASSRATLALRTEVEAVLQMATRFSQPQGQPVRQSRWLPALSPAIEGTVSLSPGTALVAAAGYEVAAGHTDLYVGGQKTATIPSSRATAEIGVRMRF